MNEALARETMQLSELAKLRLLVVSDAAPSRNGVGAYYQDLIEHLQDKVESITLVSPRIVDGRWQAGLVLPLPGDSTQKLCLPNAWKLNRLLRELKPDIVIVATPGVYGITGAFLAGRHGIPFLCGFHTSFEQLTELYWPDSLRGKIVEAYFRCSNGYLLRRCEAVLGNAEPILEQARSLGAPKLELVGTPLASDFIQRPLRPYDGACERLFFAGRLAREKNIEAILEAAAHMPDCRFSIAGDGPLRPLVERAAAEYGNLSYLGWLDREQLCAAVDEHDILLLPSHFETFGTIALEAMARQRLVLVSEGCGISDWNELRPGLFVIESGQDLRTNLQRIAALSTDARRARAAQALRCARALNEQVVGQWGELLLRTLRDSRAGKQRAAGARGRERRRQ